MLQVSPVRIIVQLYQGIPQIPTQTILAFISYFSLCFNKTPDRNERVKAYLGSWFWRDLIHPSTEGTVGLMVWEKVVETPYLVADQETHWNQSWV